MENSDLRTQSKLYTVLRLCLPANSPLYTSDSRFQEQLGTHRRHNHISGKTDDKNAIKPNRLHGTLKRNLCVRSICGSWINDPSSQASVLILMKTLLILYHPPISINSDAEGSVIFPPLCSVKETFCSGSWVRKISNSWAQKNQWLNCLFKAPFFSTFFVWVLH